MKPIRIQPDLFIEHIAEVLVASGVSPQAVYAHLCRENQVNPSVHGERVERLRKAVVAACAQMV